VIVFDSNETLLDLAPLDVPFAGAFGQSAAVEMRKKWFKQVVEQFLTVTVIGTFRPFEELADAALDVVTAAHGYGELDADDRAAIHAAMLVLPAYSDVIPALELLEKADVRLAVLTNSGARSARAQMKQAGLADYFDEILSAGEVDSYKPAKVAYAHAAKKLGVDLDEIRMVAAHAWDISGALAAGCRAAFVRRPEKALDPRAPAPDIIGAGMLAVAREIVERDG
jgi:2-haloacid dehalogenase